MKRSMFVSFRARIIAAGTVPILVIGAAALFSAFVSSLNMRNTAQLFSLDLFIEESLASADAVVANLGTYIDTKNSDALRACMHHSKILAARANELFSGTLYRESNMTERNLSVLMKRLIHESESVIRAKRGRNIPEYTSRYQDVQRTALFIHERADVLSLERLKLNLETFTAMAKEAGRAITLLVLMLVSAMTFVVSTVAHYALKLTDPLNELACAAARISAGNFSGSPLPERGDDEIAQTAAAFNMMQSSIRAYIGEITNKAAVEASLMEERLKNLEMEGLLRNAELKTLQARINPHFLFNTLNAGIQLATVEDADRTRVFLEKLGGLMRYSFRDLDAPVALADELQCLRDYAYLMGIRFPDAITFEIESTEDADSASVPKMIIQPLIENSIQHGFADLSAGGRISVKAHVHEKSLVIRIADNGSGISSDTACAVLRAADEGNTSRGKNGTPVSGFGMANVIARLRIFAGCRDVVEFLDASPGAIIVLKVPYKKW